MRTYGQYCPIARGSEVVAERWTPIILRNILLGCHTFNEIAAGAPGLSRALLTRRLHELERAGVIDIRPKPGGHGSLYEPTSAGRDLSNVLDARRLGRKVDGTDKRTRGARLRPVGVVPDLSAPRSAPRRESGGPVRVPSTRAAGEALASDRTGRRRGLPHRSGLRRRRCRGGD